MGAGRGKSRRIRGRLRSSPVAGFDYETVRAGTHIISRMVGSGEWEHRILSPCPGRGVDPKNYPGSTLHSYPSPNGNVLRFSPPSAMSADSDDEEEPNLKECFPVETFLFQTRGAITLLNNEVEHSSGGGGAGQFWSLHNGFGMFSRPAEDVGWATGSSAKNNYRLGYCSLIIRKDFSERIYGEFSVEQLRSLVGAVEYLEKLEAKLEGDYGRKNAMHKLTF